MSNTSDIRCYASCRRARKTARCRCPCGGAYHGEGEPVIRWNGREYTPVLPKHGRKGNRKGTKGRRGKPWENPSQFRMIPLWETETEQELQETCEDTNGLS